MTLVVRSSRELPAPPAYAYWLATTGTEPGSGLDPARKLPGLSQRLEESFEQSRELWLQIGRDLGDEPTAELAQMPTGAFGSDFGVMLAWSRLAEALAGEEKNYLALCDDPWLFRHLSGIAGVKAGKAPPLFLRTMTLRVRGIMSRLMVGFRMAMAALHTRRLRGSQGRGEPAILVYGHPSSTADGFDAYFGELMREMPGLKRILHTDCPAGRALELGADGRTASVHGWGSAIFAITLVNARWRPLKRHLAGSLGWLIRRAAEVEGSGGAPAMNRWQHHCQRRWLSSVRPPSIAWPWENHAWERDLCRAAGPLGVRTVGYQHTVIGPHQINYNTASNPDGLDSVPQHVVCNGPVYRNELKAWGVPENRLVIGGAFRFKRFEADLYDPGAPVFVPLSGTTQAALQQIAAAKIISASGRRVLIKEHPMYPLDFEEGGGLSRTDVPLVEQPALSAVLYSNGTSGLEALLAGVPTFRLMLEDRIAIDILPADIGVPAVSVDGAADAVAAAEKPPRLEWESVLSQVNMDVWSELLRKAP